LEEGNIFRFLPGSGLRGSSDDDATSPIQFVMDRRSLKSHPNLNGLAIKRPDLETLLVICTEDISAHRLPVTIQ
jgi:hypothetical protein